VSLRLKLDFAGCIVFWWILELLFDANDYKLPTNYDAIGFVLNVEPALIRSVIEDFWLFVVDEKRMQDVFGDEIEQELIRNKSTKYEV